MSHLPTAYPCVIEEKLLRIERRLARDGEILVEVGQRVAADEVVAIGRGGAPAIVIDAAGELGVPPEDVIKGLAQAFWAPVKAGEVLVGVRVGLRRKEMRAREDGVLVSADVNSGHLRFQPTGERYELKAYVSGVVDEIEGRSAVTISSVATRVQGIWGLGSETIGVLNVVTGGREEDLSPDHVDSRAALGVIVGGRSASADALKKAAAAGVKAVVLGGIEETELRSFLTMQGRAKPRWYVGGPHWHIATSAPVLPFTLILTEGFGKLAMAEEIFAVLRRGEGREVSLNGATCLRGQSSRPEIIIPSATRTDAKAEQMVAAGLKEGTRVRLVDPQHLGHHGLVRGEALRRPAADGVIREVIEIELDSGGRLVLPVGNIEVLA